MKNNAIIVSLCAFCYNKSVLFLYYKAISTARPEPTVEQRVAGLGGTPDALLDLGTKIGKPKAGEKLTSAKEAISNAAGTTLREISRLKDEFLKDPEAKKAVLGMAAVGFLAWVLSPEKEETQQKAEKKDEKPRKPDEQPSVIPPKKAMEELATIPPLPEKVLAEIEKRAGGFKKLREEYDNEKDPQKKKKLAEQIKILFEKATGVHESGNKEYLLNMYAARPDQSLGRKLKGMGIDVSPFIFNSSSSLLGGKGEYLKDFKTFKDRVCSSLQPNVKDEKDRVNKTAEILARCAVGKYQILPIYFFKGMGWEYQGEKGLENIFNFLKSESLQKQMADKIITRLGEKYDWNPLYMAAAYYAGEKWGDKLQKAPKDPALEKQQGRYRSIKGYAQHTCELMDRLVQKA